MELLIKELERESLIDDNYTIDSLFDNIKNMVLNSKNRVYSAVNTEILDLYWNIGNTIINYNISISRKGVINYIIKKMY